MPLIVEIWPIGVRKIYVTGDTADQQDACLIVWPFIRPHLERLDATLRAEAPDLVTRLRDINAQEDGKRR